MASGRWHYLAGLGQCPPGCDIYSKSGSNTWRYGFSHSQYSWVWESRCGNESDFFLFYPRDPPGKFLLAIPATLVSAGLETFTCKRRNASTKGHTIPLSCKLRLPPDLNGSSCHRICQRRNTLLYELGWLSLTVKVNLRITMRVKRNISGIQGIL